jgi:hypothetical protein
MDTSIVDSSICIEYIMNSMQHWIQITRMIKIEGSMKLIRRTQGMKPGFISGVRLVNTDRSVAESGTKVARFHDMFSG